MQTVLKTPNTMTGMLAILLDKAHTDAQARVYGLEITIDQMALELEAVRAENARLLDLAELAKLQIANEDLRKENEALAARNKTLDLVVRAKDATIQEQANTMARLLVGNDIAQPSPAPQCQMIDDQCSMINEPASPLVPPLRPSVENPADPQTINAEMAQPDAPEGEPVLTEAAFAGAVEFVRAH